MDYNKRGSAGLRAVMVHHPKRHPYEDDNIKFWLLFFVGLVIVLILFRAFAGAVEGRGGFGSEQSRRDPHSTHRKRRRDQLSSQSGAAEAARLKAMKMKDVESHLD